MTQDPFFEKLDADVSEDESAPLSPSPSSPVDDADARPAAPFFEKLGADVSRGSEDESPSPSPSPSASVDDVGAGFEQAAVDTAAVPPDSVDTRPTELVGAAAPPLEGDLARPRSSTLPPRTAPPGGSAAPPGKSGAARRRGHRGLALLALGGLVVLFGVVALLRPVTPADPARPQPRVLRATGPSSPVATIGDTVGRSLAAARDRIASARRVRGHARRTRIARVRSRPRKHAHVRRATAPARATRPSALGSAPRAPAPQPPPARPANSVSSPDCVEFPPC